MNSRAVPDRYPLPDLRDSTQSLRGCTVFSKIDLVRAYYNIPIFKDDIHKTALISPCGLHEYLRMSFGLRNAPSTFQRFIGSIFQDLPFIFTFLDDSLIFSRNIEEHFKHLEIVFSRLNEVGLTMNLSKCIFVSEEVDFLGQTITKDGFKPTEERLQLIKNLPLPNNIAKLRKALGIFNFYRKFNPNAAAQMAPLNELLKGHT